MQEFRKMGYQDNHIKSVLNQLLVIKMQYRKIYIFNYINQKVLGKMIPGLLPNFILF